MKKDLLLLLLLLLPAITPLIQKGYFSMHDDLQSMRQYQLDKCFADWQIPCRWTPDLGYGYGYPIFNYYPPLPYLIGQPFRALGFQYIDVVKIIGILGFGITALNMYLLGREFWGRGGGLISSVFYTYAPYHSVDFYVRGAINEFWAMAFYPLIFWTTYKLIASQKPKWISFASLSIAALMLSHNPMLMIFAPVLILWCLFWLIKFRSVKSIVYLTIRNLSLSALWSLGLAAFFTLPVLFETKFVSVWTLTSGYFNYLAHFLDVRQIFLNINWGYGSSELGPNDSMSFALGFLHWIIPILILLFIFSKKFINRKSLIIILALITLGALFMSHSKSTPIWLALKPLEFLQFPWRFLPLAVFTASFLSGAIMMATNKKIFVPLIISLLIFMNGNYFRPREWYPSMTDAQKFSGKSWQLLVTSGIFDYLPIYAPAPPADPVGADLNISQGLGTFIRIIKTSNLQKYSLDITSPQSLVELQTYYFPGWRYWIDGAEVKNYNLDPLLGRPQLSLPTGRHEIVAKFTNTPIRTLGNTLSLISWSLLLLSFNRKISIWMRK